MLAAPVQAQDFDAGRAAFDAGRAAFDAGDYIEAVSSFRMAAEQGHVTAQVGLGFMYFDGLYVLQDYIEAAHWYRMAAEQGDTTAQSLLGEMYEYGQGVPQDYVTAHMWYNLGAANGNTLGGPNRDRIAEIMTPSDISEAQRRARVCMESSYQDCD